jgi:hypothetical protein
MIEDDSIGLGVKFGAVWATSNSVRDMTPSITCSPN